MDETIIFPSSNWFHSSVLAVSKDGWLMYGGISKSLCILEPLQANGGNFVEGNQGYQAHYLNKAHNEKIVTVDISPDWPAKKCILTGSADGAVKQWTLEQVNGNLKIKSSLTNDYHQHQKEEVSGVGYCNNDYAVTVGSYGHIVKWDLNSNVLKSFNNVLKNFKPTCMSCSPHLHLNIAVGTKQGVVFVLDLNGAARVVYKVRGHDDEIIRVGWCPQFEVTVRKMLKEIQARSVATERMKRIRQEPEDPEVMKQLDDRVKKSAEVEHFLKTAEKTNEQSKSVATTVESENVVETKIIDESASTSNAEFTVEKEFNKSGVGKTLPEDSFDDTVVVQEDDMFDIYKDHEADEFGHKKYQPEDIFVRVKEEKEQEDYMTECMQLKEEILKRKQQAEASIGDLVEAFDKAAIVNKIEQEGDKTVQEGDKKEQESDKKGQEDDKTEQIGEGDCKSDENKDETTVDQSNNDSSAHIHRHLLATVGKHGSVKVWSKTGKAVGSGMLPHVNKQKQPKGVTMYATLLWYKPDVLVLADFRSQLQQCNPLKIDCKNKFDFKVIHTHHKRGLYAISTNAPRVMTAEMLQEPTHDDDWYIYTTAQDRSLIKYSLKKNCVMSTHNTAGGFVYMIETCPYDAGKIAIAVGDGAVRVWETTVSDEDETKLKPGVVHTYWQNVMGKVITVTWHPTRENLLAFGTGEARVGLIDVSGKTDKSARVLQSALNGGVYSLCWGENNDLYACASGELVVYDADKVGDAPSPLKVEVEGNKWELSAVRWDPRGLAVGSLTGGVAVLTANKPHEVNAVAFVFNKIIHTIAWHPLETSSATEESPYKNHLAVCSNDKVNTIVILEYTDKEDGTKQLSTYKTLSGHKQQVLQLAWNPHEEATLISSSLDRTVRIWNTTTGECTSIFGNHLCPTFCVSYVGWPQVKGALTGGADGCLRLWDPKTHAADKFDENKFTEELSSKKQKKKKEKKDAKSQNADDDQSGTEETGTAVLEAKVKANKKFLLPMIEKQINACTVNALKMVLKKYIEKTGEVMMESLENIVQQDIDFVKLFGTMNELNDLLDTELERHQDMGTLEAYAMLCIFRGHIDVVVQHAVKRDLLDTFLLSVTPSVSHVYWKEVTQLYLAQIDRLTAKSADAALNCNKSYGGPVYRKAAALLNLHDVIGAVKVLTEARLFKEAYVLCRTRYIDSIADETLEKWAKYCYMTGNTNMAALCYIALGNLTQAITILGQSTNEETLRLAADIAKVIGQTSFAHHIDKKREEIKVKEDQEETATEEVLENLPTRVELACNDDLQVLLKEIDAKMEKLLKEKANDTNVNEDKTKIEEGIVNVNEDKTNVEESIANVKDSETNVNDKETHVTDLTNVNNEADYKDGEINVKDMNVEHNEGAANVESTVKDNVTTVKYDAVNVKDNEACGKDSETDVKDNEKNNLEERENNPNANNVTEV